MSIREIKTQNLYVDSIKDSAGTTIIDIVTKTVNDSGGISSIDINGRNLNDSSGNVSVAYQAHQLYNTAGNLKLNWDGSGVDIFGVGGNISLAPDTFVVDVNNSNIVNVLDPVNPLDAVNKQYADGISAGLNPKMAVRAATTANLTYTYATSPSNGRFSTVPLTGLFTVDGTLLVTGDRLLVKDQTDQKQNGIYVYDGGAGTLTRSTDMDGTPANEVAGGDFTFVQTGGQAGTGWVVVFDGNIVLNTNNVPWTQFAGSNNFAFRDLSNLVATDINQALAFQLGVVGDVHTKNAASSQPLNLYTGNSSSSTSGTVSIYTGTSPANSGDIDLTTGVPGAANPSGNINLNTANATGSSSGQIALVTGTTDTGVAGMILLNTGAASGAGTSGAIELITGDGSSGSSGALQMNTGNGGAGGSGVVSIFSGNANAAPSGSISIYSGSATGAASGAVSIYSNGSDTATGQVTIQTGSTPLAMGSIYLQAGAGGGQGATGGAIVLMSSAGYGSPDAAVQIQGVGTQPLPLRFYDNTNASYVSFQAAATIAAPVTWTLPNVDGPNGASLVTDGAGGLSWAESSAWTKYTVAYAAFATAATTNSITLFSLPAKGTVEEIVVKHSTAFSGTGITAYTVSVGITGNVQKYASAFNVFSAVSGTNFQTSESFGMENFGAATAILITATSTGANLNAGSGTGSVDVWVRTSLLP